MSLVGGLFSDLCIIIIESYCRGEYYNGNQQLPVYKWTMPKEHFSVESLARLLLDLDSSVASGKLKTCTTQPVQVCHNVSFLIDIQALDDPMDIRADENGAWDRKGSPVAYVSIHNGRGTTAVYKRNHMGSHSHHYKITRVYYRHSSSPDFTRIITTVNGKLVVA